MKVIQICYCPKPEGIVGLCEDGSLLFKKNLEDHWTSCEPQPEPITHTEISYTNSSGQEFYRSGLAEAMEDAAQPAQVDPDAFWESMKASYPGLNVDVEKEKMRKWATDNGKGGSIGTKFVINWLNKARAENIPLPAKPKTEVAEHLKPIDDGVLKTINLEELKDFLVKEYPAHSAFSGIAGLPRSVIMDFIFWRSNKGF
jgi:hypothetical protein